MRSRRIMRLFRYPRRHAGSTSPGKALPESGDVRGLAALPRMIRRLVGRELCPGEKVARIGRPEAPDDATIRRQLIWWVLGAPVTLLVFGVEYWQAVAWLSTCWLGPQTLHYLVHRWRHRYTVYVATNQRCFELSAIGW